MQNNVRNRIEYTSSSYYLSPVCIDFFFNNYLPESKRNQIHYKPRCFIYTTNFEIYTGLPKKFKQKYKFQFVEAKKDGAKLNYVLYIERLQDSKSEFVNSNKENPINPDQKSEVEQLQNKPFEQQSVAKSTTKGVNKNDNKHINTIQRQKLRINHFDEKIDTITQETQRVKIHYAGHEYIFQKEDIDDFKEKKVLAEGAFGKIYDITKSCQCCPIGIENRFIFKKTKNVKSNLMEIIILRELSDHNAQRTTLGILA